jgi:heat shock protein HslJ
MFIADEFADILGDRPQSRRSARRCTRPADVLSRCAPGNLPSGHAPIVVDRRRNQTGRHRVVRHMRRLTLALLPLLLLTACTGPASGAGPAPGGRGSAASAGPNGIGPNEWPGRRAFLSTTITEHGKDRPLVPGTRIELSLGKTGGIGAYAGCNHMGSADAHLSNGRLSVTRIIGTAIGCNQQLSEQDSWLTDFLEVGPGWQLTGNDLVLRGGDVEIRLVDRQTVTPDRPLTGTRWKIHTWHNSTPTEAYLVFDGKGGFTGSTGCSPVSGRVTIGADTLTFADIRHGASICSPTDTESENSSVLKALRDKVTYEIDVDQLALSRDNDTVLVLDAKT